MGQTQEQGQGMLRRVGLGNNDLQPSGVADSVHFFDLGGGLHGYLYINPIYYTVD